MIPGDWIKQGLCSSHPDPEMWFIGGRQQHKAKAICDWCPVKAACAEWAIDQPGVSGVWGGLSTHQRIVIRSQRKVAS